ncbi:unnamed protein product [Periconia digitata]|uniref:FAD-binding domain-containing protein n=1 Tax=Periconia digitata TaxID=1303443 RepID=A0A9W4UFE0_9PLEO|nr:unnamed protein product [Periconia digitata]
MSLNILVVGAGLAGPALASLLQRSSITSAHHITVVERNPSLRTAGQQIDIKAQGIPILKKMNLLKTMRQHCVAETGFEFLDKNDNMIAQFGVNPVDKRGFGLTSEYEIMRGDMVKVLYDDSLSQRAEVEKEQSQSTRGSLTYEFDKSIETLEQSASHAEVTFSDGQRKRYDLVVAADGQASRTRRLAFGKEISDASFRSMGLHTGYFDVPRLPNENSVARGHSAQQRLFITRPSGRPVTGVYIFTKKDFEGLRGSYDQSIEKQKEIWIRNLDGLEWQKERFAEGIRNCTDFYAHEQGQVRMEKLYKGRVVLLGDSGYCPSPFTGLGTTSALIGAYVLAGELARNGTNVDAALENYQKLAKPPVTALQHLPTENMGFLFPSSRLGVWVLSSVMRAIYKLGIDKMMPDIMDSAGGTKWSLPEYPEMKFNADEPST